MFVFEKFSFSEIDHESVIFIPPTILIILSSFVFAKEYGQFDGIVLSCLACSLGAVLGANISYLRSKYITRDIVKLFSKRYRIIRAADSGMAIV